MGLSVTSSIPKNITIGTSSTSSAEAVPGDFLALLTSELGNFLSPPTADSTTTLTGSTAKSDEKPLAPEDTETITLQVDPALIASLNAAAKPVPTATPAPLTSEESAVADGISPYGNSSQAQGISPPSLSDKTPNSIITSISQAINTTKPLTTTQSGYGSLKSEPQAFNPDLAPNTIQAQTQTAPIPPAQSGFLNLVNNGLTPEQPAPVEINGLTSTTPTPQSFLTHGLNSRPAQHIESQLKTPLQEPAWPQQFGDKIVWLAKTEAQSAQININPPELGPIQITLNLSGDQAKISFASPHLEVRQTIENALPHLKEMLSSNGISLGQANVGSNLQQPPRETASQNTNGRRSTDENAILSGSEVTLATGSSTVIQRGRGLVDLFA